MYGEELVGEGKNDVLDMSGDELNALLAKDGQDTKRLALRRFTRRTESANECQVKFAFIESHHFTQTKTNV